MYWDRANSERVHRVITEMDTFSQPLNDTMLIDSSRVRKGDQHADDLRTIYMTDSNNKVRKRHLL